MKQTASNLLWTTIVLLAINSCSKNLQHEGTPDNDPPPVSDVITLDRHAMALYFEEEKYDNHYVVLSNSDMKYDSDGQCLPAAPGYAIYLDFYTDKTGNSETLPEGEYKFAFERDDHKCLIENTLGLLTDENMETATLTCLVGKVVVSKSSDNYDIKIEMTDVDGNEYEFAYTGPLVFKDATPPDLFSPLDKDVDIMPDYTKAQHLKDPFFPEVDVVSLSLSTVALDEEGSLTGPGEMVHLMLVTDVVPDPEFPFLYPGEYNAGEDMLMNTFLKGEIVMSMYLDGSYYLSVDDESNIKVGLLSSGSVNIVEESLGSYNVSGDLTTAEGKKVSVSYTGPINVAKDPSTDIGPSEDLSSLTEDRVSDFSSVKTAKAEYYGDIYFIGSDIWHITLGNPDGDVMMFELYAEPGDGSYLPSAEYTPIFSTEYPRFMPGTNKDDPEGTWLLDYSSGERFALAPAMNGSVTVMRDGENYSISYSFGDGASDGQHIFSGEWSGTIDIEQIEY